MTKASNDLQDLRRRIYVEAKAETTWRFWGLYVHVCKMETLPRIEQGEGMVQGNFSTITKIQRALEREGITFTANQDDGIGVRLQKKPQRS